MHLIQCHALLHSFGGCHQCRSNPANLLPYGLGFGWSCFGVLHRKHAMLWLFQVFALTAGLYGCQVWANFSLTYDSSVTTRARVFHLGFLKKLLGFKKGTDTHCVLRETGQMPIFIYWFRCTIRFWNSLLSSNNPLLEKIVRADLFLANRSDTRTYQVLCYSLL